MGQETLKTVHWIHNETCCRFPVFSQLSFHSDSFRASMMFLLDITPVAYKNPENPENLTYTNPDH